MPDRPSQFHLDDGYALREAGGLKLRVARRRAAASGRAPLSPHLLDLTARPGAAKPKPVVPDPPPSAPRGIIGQLRHLLDEKIHLHDLRVRTLSVRPRGWKDFPPASATTLQQAVWLTVKRFFNEHPLADLTILSVVHLAALLVWHLATLPARALPAAAAAKTRRAPAKAPAMPMLLPLLAVKDEGDAPTPVPAPPVAPARDILGLLGWQKPLGWQRSVLGFAATALVFVLPITAAGAIGGLRGSKERVMDRAVSAAALLKAAGEAAAVQDFGAARQAFAQARENFEEARAEIGALALMLNTANAVLPDGSPIGAAGPLLVAGREMADGGERLAAAMTELEQADDPTEKIRILRDRLRDALPHLDRAGRELSKVSPAAVPDEYRDTIVLAKTQTPKLTDGARRAVAVADLLEGAMGHDEPKRYLVIFQNNAELRPTGGFMGSFALVDVSKGKVRKMEIPGGGTYDLKGSLSARISSPQPLHLVNARWQFQDANWYPDFPSSAKQITWFYDKSGGPTTDGVIAINATFMEKLLALVGPVEMPEYGKTITAQNFFFETQKEVELDYDKTENKPKKFIADLAPKVLDRVINADRKKFLELAALLDQGLGDKELQFWFRNSDLQARASGLGWTGETKSTDGDYLSIVHTNIAGQKTDLVMKEEVHHAVKVLPDGSGIVTLSIQRTHHGQKGALFSGVRNVDYLRVYVPKDSVLVEARGFEAPDPKLFKVGDPSDAEDPAVAEIERAARFDRGSGTRIAREGDKTVFGNWVQTDPGETSVVTLVYQLPPGTIKVHEAPDGGLAKAFAKLSDGDRRKLEYTLLVQKQAGLNPVSFTSSVDVPRGYGLAWSSPERAEDDRGRMTSKTLLTRDAFFGAMAEER